MDLGERPVWGRKPNMLQECFNLSQLPSSDKGLVFIKFALVSFLIFLIVCNISCGIAIITKKLELLFSHHTLASYL
jgi:hypothetical protein